MSMKNIDYSEITQNLGTDYAKNVPSTGDSLKEILKYFKIEVAYGVGGDYVAGLIDALHPDIATLPGANELNAAFTACGHAEIRGISCCIMTYTVGSLPVLSAAALAIAENIPVIFISGAPGENEIGETFLHHTVVNHRNLFPRYDAALDAFRAVGVRAERLQGRRSKLQPSNASLQFFELVHYAWKNNQPVFVEIPRDLIKQPTQPLIFPRSPKLLQTTSPLVAGNSEIIMQIEQKLEQSKAPLIFMGQYIKRDRPLRESVINFARKRNIPFVTTWLAKGFFDEQDILCKGAYNGIFSPNTMRSIEDTVDYIIEIGTSIQRQDINYAFNSQSQWLSDFENKTRITGALLDGDNLEKSFKELAKQSTARPCQVFWDHLDSEPLQENEKLTYKNIAHTLNNIQHQTERTMVYLPEVGNSMFASFGLRNQVGECGRGWIANPWYAAMGTSLAYARALAHITQSENLRDIPVVLTGDGGFQFQINELAHIQQQNLSVIVVYMRNNTFSLGKTGESKIYNCIDPRFNLELTTQSYGGRYHRALTTGDLARVITDAAEERAFGLVIIEIPTSCLPEDQCNEVRLINEYIRSNNE